jgi:hypothetical protein
MASSSRSAVAPKGKFSASQRFEIASWATKNRVRPGRAAIEALADPWSDRAKPQRRRKLAVVAI